MTVELSLSQIKLASLVSSTSSSGQQEIASKKIKNFKDIRPSKTWSFKHVSRSDTTALTHSYHRYPAKFIPNIVEKLINDYTQKKDLILDPFGGCGTTLVESKKLGRKSICFDINPVAKFIADVKVTPINPSVLEREFEKLQNRLSDTKDVKSPYHLNHERILYWFDKKTIRELSFIYKEIKKVKNRSARYFFLCSFSHNLKNSSRWLMKSTKPTIDKSKNIQVPSQTFIRHTKSMVKKNHQFYTKLQEDGNLKTSARVMLKDSTKRFSLKNNQVDLIVTSPPYVTSYEYADLHQLSLLWFRNDRANFSEWSSSTNSLVDFRKNFVGTSFKSKKTGIISSSTGIEILEKLHTLDKKLSEDVSNYFIDMDLAFKEMYRVLKKGKNACVVIGNTELKGVAILNAEVATEQMLRIGFKKVQIIKREIQNKIITPWRDKKTGKFTGISNPDKRHAYEYEYILVMKK